MLEEFEEKGLIEAGLLRAKLDGAATVWASSLDGKPLRSSGRILFCHLTDVQNTEIAYADSSRKELLRWGRLPHLMRKAKADVLLDIGTGDWKVFALDCAGNRRHQIACNVYGGTLGFLADIARDSQNATFLYEIIR